MLKRCTKLLGSDSLGSSIATVPQPLSKVNAGAAVGQPWAAAGEEGPGSSSPYAVSYTVPSRTANAPRIVDASHYKQAVPFQKSVWSPTAEDIPVDSIAERPQAELQLICKRDEMTPVPSGALDVEASFVKKHHSNHTWRRSLWNKLTRVGQGQRNTDGLLVRDETYWRWWVEDKYGFLGKPKHLTWEQFAEELASFSMHWELHPTKPEDYLILHLVRSDAEGNRQVVWSAEHAAWQSPLLMDIYATVGTMLSRRLKTRTISFDNGRGTISELNLQHVSPHTSAVQINARPSYFYDQELRDMREENSSWYFTKELQTMPGENEEGTVSFYTCAEAVAFHLSASVKSLLNRPMWMFYRRGVRKNAQHKADYHDNSDRLTHAALSWAAWEDSSYDLWPASSQLDAITDNWLEEAPFPLKTVNIKVRDLARLRYENLETKQWVGSNVSKSKQAGTQLLTKYAPQLLLPSSEGGNDFISNLLKEDAWTERKSVYKKLTSSEVEKLMLLREADAVKEKEEEEDRLRIEQEQAKEALREEERAAEQQTLSTKEKTLEERGREVSKKRVEEGETTEDSEQWEWYHRSNEVAKSPMGAVQL